MLRIRLLSLLILWIFFSRKAYKRIKSILFKEKIISQMCELTDESIRIMSNCPLRIEDLLSVNKCDAVSYIRCELSGKTYSIDEEIKTIISSYARCFSSTDTNTVKKGLSVLRAKLEIIEKNLSHLKEEVLKVKLPVNTLITLCISIIII